MLRGELFTTSFYGAEEIGDRVQWFFGGGDEGRDDDNPD
jgi:hypothetical protein